MPGGLREKIEKHWGNRPVQLYAYADLDGSLKLNGSWVALGEDHLAVVRTDPEGSENINNVRLSDVTAIKEINGLSGTTLTILGAPNDPSLAILRYTHRQKGAMENIKFIIEQRIEGTGYNGDDDPDELYREAVTHPIREAQASIASNKMTVVWRLINYLKPYKMRLWLGIVSALILTVVSLIPAYLTGYVIDHIIKPFEAGEMDVAKAMHLATLLISALAAAYLVRAFSLWIRLNSMSVLGELVAGDLRREIYEHLQTLSLSFFSRKQTGSLISRVSSDTDRLWDFVAFGIIEVMWAVIMLAGLGVVLVTMDWQLGLIMTIPIPFFLWAFFKNGQVMQRMFLNAWRKWSNMTAVLSDTIPGIRVVKAFNQEKRENKRFDKRNVACVTNFNEIHDVWTKFWPFMIIAIHGMTILAWSFALPRMFGIGAPLTIGTFVTFLLYMGMYLQPLETLGTMARMINRATSSAHRIFEVLDTKPEIFNHPDPIRLDPVKGHVVFENVKFGYDGVRQIIRNISFEVQPGEMIGLVGPSGAGKTTVTNLLARFYDVTGGRILVDGVDVRDLDIGHFRRQVGMVLQEPHLFHGTIVDNILYSNPDASMADVIEASRTANSHDFICKLPHGYDTIIGERGHTLSGGERQRVSIARAILSNPRILIMDEATSSVDTETERKIQDALDRLVSGRTVFAIAHRLSTLRNADRLLVMEDGKITESGTHSELLAKTGGTYAKLVKMQQDLQSGV